MLLVFVTVVVPTPTIACSGAAPVHADDASQDGARAGQQAGVRAVPVAMATVVEKQMPVTVNAIGTVEAISTVQVRAQVTAQLSAITFREGDDVEAGQLLFKLDQRSFAVALQQAEGILARDRAQAANAQAEFERFQDLVKRGLIPRDQFEAQRATADALEATVAADAAAVEAAKLNLQYTRIEAPVAGSCRRRCSSSCAAIRRPRFANPWAT